MTNQETIFISAQNGGIEVYIGAGNKVGFAKTAKMLAYILRHPQDLRCSDVHK